MTVTPDDVSRAATVVPLIAVPTAMNRSARLSRRHGSEVLLKREDQQVLPARPMPWWAARRSSGPPPCGRSWPACAVLPVAIQTTPA